MLTAETIVELYRRATTRLPPDVLAAIESARTDDAALQTVLENCRIADEKEHPICQDTGTPIFYVQRPASLSEAEIRTAILKGTQQATAKILLRPNGVDPLTDENLGNSPIIHFQEAARLKVTLLLKGGGSENVTQFYALPDSALDAHRDLKGVKKCVLDAVNKAQGKGCPPYTIGVALGGDVESTIALAKRQLLRMLDDKNPDTRLEAFEKELLDAVNTLAIGPLGFGGKHTVLAVKAASMARHPATFFVAVVFGCWALRRATYEE